MYLLLLVLWFIFNGKITLEIFLFGAVICGWLYWFMSKHMDYSWRKDVKLVRKVPLYIKYAVVLVWEILKANIAVMRMILSPKMEIVPAFFKFRTDLKSDNSRVALANSITLTPGTYTVGLEDGEYTVHALDVSFLEGIEESCFVKQLRKLEG